MLGRWLSNRLIIPSGPAEDYDHRRSGNIHYIGRGSAARPGESTLTLAVSSASHSPAETRAAPAAANILAWTAFYPAPSAPIRALRSCALLTPADPQNLNKS